MGSVIDTRAITAEKMGYTNKLALLEAIRKHPGASRLGLAHRVGLDPSTVSKIVTVLIGRGLVKELGSRHAVSPGRRSVMLSVEPEAMIVLVVSIDAEITRIAFGRLDASIEELEEIPTLKNVEEFFGSLVSALQRALEHPTARHAGALVVSVPGLVDIDKNFIFESPKIGWHNVDVLHELNSRMPDLSIQVRTWTDANLALVAETFVNPRIFGMRQGINIHLSHGVGGAIWWDGRINVGSQSLAGELWHTGIDRSEPMCSCGRRGCLNACISIGRLVHNYNKESPSPLLGGSSVEKIRSLFKRYEEGDKVAGAVLEKTAVYLGEGIAQTLNALDPEFVIIGGVGAFFAPSLIDRVSQEVRQRVLVPLARDMTLLPASLSPDRAPIVGGALVGAEGLLAADLRDGRGRDA